MSELRSILDSAKKDDPESALREKQATARTAFEQARTAYTIYQNRLFAALENMQQMIDIKRLIEIIRRLEEDETKNIDELEKLRIEMQKKVLGLDEPKKDK